MELFKERLVELGFNILGWSIFLLVFLLVGGACVLLVTYLPYIVMGTILLIIIIWAGIRLYNFIDWLFIEPYKEHKKTKNEHDTKFKTH